MCLYPILRFSFYFLISWNPKFQVVLQLENQLVFNIFYTRYQVPSHLRQTKLARKQQTAKILYQRLQTEVIRLSPSGKYKG